MLFYGSDKSKKIKPWLLVPTWVHSPGEGAAQGSRAAEFSAQILANNGQSCAHTGTEQWHVRSSGCHRLNLGGSVWMFRVVWGVCVGWRGYESDYKFDQLCLSLEKGRLVCLFVVLLCCVSPPPQTSSPIIYHYV